MLTQFTCMCNCLYEQVNTVTALLTLQILGFDGFTLRLNVLTEFPDYDFFPL